MIGVVGLVGSLLACSPTRPPEPDASERELGGREVEPPRRETCVRYPIEGGSMVVCNLESPGSFRVENQSPKELAVLSHVEVELERHGDRWQSTDALVYLDPLCRPDPPTHRCVRLAPGTGVKPYAWYGFSCSGQCRPSCPDDHDLRGWWLRFVVSTCDGGRRFAGPPFRLREYEDVPL